MEKDMDLDLWPEEMWQIWHKEAGVFHIENLPYEYGFDAETETAWLRPSGKESQTIYSDIKRDDPRYVNGTDQFRSMVETVRMIENILKAKRASSKIANLSTS